MVVVAGSAAWFALAAGCDNVLGIPDTRLNDAGGQPADAAVLDGPGDAPVDGAPADGAALDAPGGEPAVAESCRAPGAPFVLAVGGGPLQTAANTDGAADDESLACGAAGQPDHVWRVRATSSAMIRVTIQPAGWLPALGVGPDCNAPMTCNNSNPSEVTLSVGANQDLFVRVDGAQTGARGPYNITFEALPP